jgi:hypothetical protein
VNARSQYLCSQTDFLPAANAVRSRTLQSNSDTKRTVKNDWVLMIFQFFCSPFFQLNCCRRPQIAMLDISTHRRNFTTPFTRLPCVTIYKAAMQKEQ